MKSLTLFKTGSIAFIALGLLHLLAHFGMVNNQEPNQLMIDMESFKIDLFGEHSLLKFHIGFSMMMGFMISAFGLQNLLSAEYIVQNRKAFLSSIIISAISFLIAFTYFHVLAYGFIFFSLVCYTFAWLSFKKIIPKGITA